MIFSSEKSTRNQEGTKKKEGNCINTRHDEAKNDSKPYWSRVTGPDLKLLVPVMSSQITTLTAPAA